MCVCALLKNKKISVMGGKLYNQRVCFSQIIINAEFHMKIGKKEACKEKKHLSIQLSSNQTFCIYYQVEQVHYV